MGTPRVDKPRRVSVKAREGKLPSQYPIKNLMSTRALKQEGNGWDELYKRAFAKLSQDLRISENDRIQGLVARMGAILQEQDPDFFKSRETTPQEWVAFVTESPMRTAQWLKHFGRAQRAPLFEQVGAAIDPREDYARPPTPEESRKQEWIDESLGLQIGSNAEQQGSGFGTGLNMMDSAANLAGTIPGVPAWLTYTPEALAASGALQPGPLDITAARPNLAPRLAQAEAAMSLVEDRDRLVALQERISGGERVDPAQMQQALQALEVSQKAYEQISAKAPEFSSYADMERDRRSAADREGASGLLGKITQFGITPRFAPVLSSVLNTYQRRNQLLAGNARPASIADDSIVGAHLQESVGDIPAGTTITPEIQQRLQQSGIAELNIVDPLSASQQALLHGTGGGQLAAELAAARTVQNALRNPPARAVQAWTGPQGKPALSRVQQAAASLGRVGGLSRLSSSAAAAADKLKNSSKLMNAMRATGAIAKKVPIIGALLQGAQGAWDVGDYAMGSGEDHLDEALKRRWLWEREAGPVEELASDIWSVPKALLWDPTDARAALADSVGSMMGADSKQQYLREYDRNRELLEENARAVADLQQALPDIDPFMLDSAAAELALNRVETKHGIRPRQREVSALEHNLFREGSVYSQDLSPAERNRAQHLMRAIGPEAFTNLFYHRTDEGLVRDTGAWKSLRHGVSQARPFTAADQFEYRNPYAQREASARSVAIQQRQAAQVQEVSQARAAETQRLRTQQQGAEAAKQRSGEAADRFMSSIQAEPQHNQALADLNSSSDLYETMTRRFFRPEIPRTEGGGSAGIVQNTQVPSRTLPVTETAKSRGSFDA